MMVPASNLFAPVTAHRLLSVSALLLLLAGCANPGPPHPPSLHLPAIVTDLTAERIGDSVRLHWTTSAKTSDGLLIAGPITAQLCRAVPPKSATLRGEASAPCSPVQRTPVLPGPSVVIDSLPPELINSSTAILEYRVELRTTRERSAGESAPAFAAAGPAPPPVTNLRVEPAEHGALLQWNPQDAVDSIELERRKLAGPPPSKSARPVGKQPLHPVSPEPELAHLRASQANADSAPFRPDAGGTLDATARRGQTYLYSAQRLRQVVLNGHVLEIRSAPSSTVTVHMRDTFPPHAPAGLEAIAATSGAATAGTAAAIDLSWTPNAELDLAGYVLYRQDGTAAPVRLTPAPIPVPGFRDLTPSPGHPYTYTVTAVDTSGNESPPSPPAQEEIQLP